MRNNKLKKIFLIGLLIFLSIYSYKWYFRPVEGNKLVNKKNEHYINDLYNSDGKHYNYLSERQKLFYKDLVDYYKNFKKKIKIDTSKYGCKDFLKCNLSLSNVYDAIILDHPELIQLSGYSYKYNNDSTIIELELNYAIRFRIQNFLGTRKIERKIDEIKKLTKNMSDKEKIIFVYEWMGENARYDFGFTYNSKNQSAYSTFIKSSGVCAAFAKSAQLIFQNIGIESFLVLGTTTDFHLWNIVKLDGQYYYFDSTVASARSKERHAEYYYDGLIQSKFSSYTTMYPERYPKLSKTEFYVK